MTDRTKIRAVDGLRGWAVALVFAVHFSGAFALAHRGTNFDQVTGILSLGSTDRLLYWLFYSHYGVYVFFAISGFVISRSFAGTRTLSGYVTFLGRRLLRIYPAFLVSLVAAVLICIHQSGSESFTVRTLVQNLVFLNGAFSLNIPAYNGVTWSLFFEFIYYIVFPFVFLLATRAHDPRRVAPLGWLLVILCAAALSYGEWFLFLPFLAGAVAGLQTEDALMSLAARCRDTWLLGLYLAITTFACLLVPLPRHTTAGVIWPASAPAYVLALSITVTLIIVRAGYASGFLHRVLTSTPLLALGRISFSFFLVHTLVLGVTVRATAPYLDGSLTSAVALGLVTFSLSCVLAFLLYAVAERPYYVFRGRSADSGDLRRPGSPTASLQDVEQG